jgi:hypothetical protein
MRLSLNGNPGRDPVRLEDRLALRPKEVARAIGVSERTVRALLTRGMPRCRLDGVIVIPLDLLREWLKRKAEEEENRVEAVAKEILDELTLLGSASQREKAENEETSSSDRARAERKQD